MTTSTDAPADCDAFRCEWKEVYYGYECIKCGAFVAFGSEPWMPLDDEFTDDGDWSDYNE